MDKEWYIIPEDFLNLYKEWIMPIAESTRYLFDDKIIFPDLDEKELIEGVKNWLQSRKLWMSKLQSKSVYEDIDIWDRYSVGGYWQQMRERKLR